jgi:hypothetical protein
LQDFAGMHTMSFWKCHFTCWICLSWDLSSACLCCVTVKRRSDSLSSNGGQWSSDGYSCNKTVSFYVEGEGVLCFGSSARESYYLNFSLSAVIGWWFHWFTRSMYLKFWLKLPKIFMTWSNFFFHIISDCCSLHVL